MRCVDHAVGEFTPDLKADGQAQFNVHFLASHFYYNFLYLFGRCRVFTAVWVFPRCSMRDHLSLEYSGFSAQRLLLLQSTRPKSVGFGSCGHELSRCRAWT